MTNIYEQIIAGIEQMQIEPVLSGTAINAVYQSSFPERRSVNQILNNPARLMYDFKVQQARDRVKLNLTVGIIEEILKS